MPAAVAKGIILSISIITALGLAVIENPQVQQWIEEQRRRIAELLRQIGEELDPQSRRTAEAFAFEGQTVADVEGLKREAEGSRDAAAMATGRSLSSASTIRRIPIKGPSDPDEAEERRRKGREYLARRNQQMLELQGRRNADAKANGLETPPTPTFDELVDAEGKLKLTDEALPSPPNAEPLPTSLEEEMRQVERNLSQPIMLGESSSSFAGPSGWRMGVEMADPFSDEYALERSMTPKPPVPPKIELDPPVSVPAEFTPQRAPTPPISVPGSFSPISTEPQREQPPVNHDELSYEEQLAIALSLSEQESSSNAATVRQTRREEEDDDALRAAIAASLKDMDDQQAAHAIAYAEPSTPRPIAAHPQPLVDLTPSTPPAQPNWGDIFDHRFSPAHEPLSLAPSSAPSEASDELYRLTPELTRARLANWDAQVTQAPPSSTGSSLPYDPVRDTQSTPQPVQDLMDASFYSAPDVVSPPASVSTHTLDRETPQLIDVSEGVPHESARTPTSRAHSSFGFQTDSDSDTFASVSPSQSRPESRARSEVSGIEVIDVAEDSDIDMLSEEGDGVATPDSWSEVGSRDADSDMEDQTQEQSARLSS
ncbi:hypothetical protein M409DRAFT_21752 [Zasmidium cellare ATCC 36951]|uniref:Uncharacterized protein n=1 Tax=Zasmidium cellare ATCC 36951 TaxID=1080233 RepID=A0A6A6CMD4_ZASCE|nr:uncharacterized protein M409DRAFT_21752 [Zasmidium cellare ATCC 36951]KAF2168315.1 hypothetical protein M409DRAFT_21752 [Zasmidium cellare ATCC 36951]